MDCRTRVYLEHLFENNRKSVKRRQKVLGCCAVDLYYHLCMQDAIDDGYPVDFDVYNLMTEIWKDDEV